MVGCPRADEWLINLTVQLILLISVNGQKRVYKNGHTIILFPPPGLHTADIHECVD